MDNPVLIRRYWIKVPLRYVVFFFFNDTATTEIYTLSLHDALPIYLDRARLRIVRAVEIAQAVDDGRQLASCLRRDRKSTRLNSSHSQISYAVFCLKKKKRSEIVHVERYVHDGVVYCRLHQTVAASH